MKFIVRLLLLVSLSIPAIAFSQQSDTLINKLDSLSRKTDSAGGQVNNISAKAYNENTRITFNSYFVLLGSDLKQSFTKPFHMTGKDWGTLGKFAIVTGALAFADEPIQKGALRLRSKQSRLSECRVNTLPISVACTKLYALAALGAYGFIFKNTKMQTTTLLATQAYIAGGAVESVTKFLAGRTRPSYYPSGTEAEPRFLGPFFKNSDNFKR